MADREPLAIIVVPGDGRESRTFRVSPRRLRLLGGLLAVGVLVLALGVGSWWYLAARAARVHELESTIESLRVDRERMAAFAAELEELEARYERIRRLFGSESTQVTSELWLPPPAASGPGRRDSGSDGSGLPTTWPLTERGFVTRTLLEAESGEHPGLDIAIPVHSYIRAAGPGTVVEVGEDPVYGLYITVDHGAGYRSLYAHASMQLVEVGQTVRRAEVIGLSGNTGRSSAPHLHFEIQRDGEAVDPLTLVRQPG